MTALLIVSGLVFAAFALYVARQTVRVARGPDDFLDGGGTLPGWTFIFAGTGVALAAVGVYEHLLLTALYGLQYSHVAIGFVLVGLCGALVHKRLWLAARIAEIRSPVELLGRYFGSVSIRIAALAVLLLFAVPVSAVALARLGDLVAAVTAGEIGRAQAIWASGFFLCLFSAVGGWRAAVYVTAALSFAVLVLAVFAGTFPGLAEGSAALLSPAVQTPAGIVADRIPGVMQYTAGLGKEAPLGGPWTALAILTFALSMVGVVLSPGFAFLGLTTQSRSAFAFGHVWMIAGLAAGVLLLFGPAIGAQLASGADPATGPSFAALAARLGDLDMLASLGLVVLVLAGLQLSVVFFVSSAASVVTLDFTHRYLLPGLDARGRRLAARITLVILFSVVALAATLASVPAAVLASVALALSVQLLPAWLGLCWVPWISRSAVIAGLILGVLAVLFTEPPGLVLFEGLFVDLPWGRWPLTIHSAAWGLALNVPACLLVSIFTRGGAEREHRELLHEEFRRSWRTQFGGPAARGATWSLTLIWAFLALGPGAILGNTFFSQPVFTEGEAALGVPSLWVWQIVFWFAGVFLVWWLAYRTGLSVLGDPVTRTLPLPGPARPLGRRAAPGWLALLVSRLTER